MKSKYTTAQVVEAYQRCGTVWEAGKSLGLCGQTVWERLKAVGYPMHGRDWTEAENNELRVLSETCTIGEIARRLGRTYGATAAHLSSMDLHVEIKRQRKIPRGAGFDKASVRKHMKCLDSFKGKITQYCRANSLSVDILVAAVQKENMLWWETYSAAHADLPQKGCYCGRTFFPMNAKQQTCSRKCQADSRSDRNYFNGNRRNTVGLAQGICQLCGRKDVKGLSSHHVFGRENDPEGNWLVALCPGCHHIIGTIASRRFIEEAAGWENLINLVMLRHANGSVPGFYTYVEVEPMTEEEILSDEDGSDNAA